MKFEDYAQLTATEKDVFAFLSRDDLTTADALLLAQEKGHGASQILAALLKFVDREGQS